MTGPAGSEQSSRHKILVAAATMLGENPAARLSVRAVAARAGVSTGSLRHHFPTQRALQDEVLAGIYRLVAPDDPIHQTDRPARDRLVDCLRQVLARIGPPEQARALWRQTYETFMAPEPTAASRAAYLAMDREMQHRVEHWLAVLAEEGALPPGDTTRRARFLLTVANGLWLERALPAPESPLAAETTTLYTAVDAVLRD